MAWPHHVYNFQTILTLPFVTIIPLFHWIIKIDPLSLVGYNCQSGSAWGADRTDIICIAKLQFDHCAATCTISTAKLYIYIYMIQTRNILQASLPIMSNEGQA